MVLPELIRSHEKIAWHNCGYWDAQFIVFGVPDESGSLAGRQGASLGPSRIRRISNERDLFHREGKTSRSLPQTRKEFRIHDYGDVRKIDLSFQVKRAFSHNKIPVTIGGDHSITTEVIRSYPNKNKLGVVYFDAHPDFICSKRNYYGSVVCDVSSMPQIDFKKSVLLGIRAPEYEELENIEKEKANILFSYEMADMTSQDIFQWIKKRIGKNFYLSIDMDVIDPSFAPGVDTPVPGGLVSNKFISLLKKLGELNPVGFDITETSPPHDVKDMTSHLAAKILIEIVSSYTR